MNLSKVSIINHNLSYFVGVERGLRLTVIIDHLETPGFCDKTRVDWAEIFRPGHE